MNQWILWKIFLAEDEVTFFSCNFYRLLLFSLSPQFSYLPLPFHTIRHFFLVFIHGSTTSIIFFFLAFWSRRQEPFSLNISNMILNLWGYYIKFFFFTYLLKGKFEKKKTMQFWWTITINAWEVSFVRCVIIVCCFLMPSFLFVFF